MIRILKAVSIYPQYETYFFGRHPQVRSQQYEEQLSAIMRDRFAWADSWKKALEATGRFVVEEVLFGVASLQRRWASEHDLTVSDDWAIEVLQAQIEQFRPDVLIAIGREITPSVRKRLRRACRSIKLIVGYDGVASNNAGSFEGCDFVISCVPSAVSFYLQHGFRAALLKHGFSSAVLDDLRCDRNTIQASFVGGMALGRSPHLQRISLLAKVSRRAPVDLYLSVPPISRIGYSVLRGVTRDGIAETARLGADIAHLIRVNRGPRFGLDMFETLASSRVSLNVHIDSAGENARRI